MVGHTFCPIRFSIQNGTFTRYSKNLNPMQLPSTAYRKRIAYRIGSKKLGSFASTTHDSCLRCLWHLLGQFCASSRGCGLVASKFTEMRKQVNLPQPWLLVQFGAAI